MLIELSRTPRNPPSTDAVESLYQAAVTKFHSGVIIRGMRIHRFRNYRELPLSSVGPLVSTCGAPWIRLSRGWMAEMTPSWNAGVVLFHAGYGYVGGPL